MKFTNESKIGLLAIVVIASFIIGFNFLKGKNVFGHSKTLNAKFNNIQGLSASNPVIINGMQVGTVKEIINDKSMTDITVIFSIDKDIDIPANSVAAIYPNPLTQTRVEIKLGDAKTFLKNNDHIKSLPASAYLDDVINKVDPVINSVNGAIISLDSLIQKVAFVIDANNKNNLSASIENLNKITASILSSSASLEKMLNTTNGPLANTMSNVNAFSENLKSNNDKVNQIINNIEKSTTNIAELDLKSSIKSLNDAIVMLKNTMTKLNSNEGSMGLLLNDPVLYKNLTATSNKLNLLLDDLRINPKRYVSVSVFGKKDKGAVLTQPLPDTVNAPYLPKSN